MPQCTKGHEYQCRTAIRDRCECTCQGENHGAAYRPPPEYVGEAERLRARIRRGPAQEKGAPSDDNARRPT